MLDLGSLGSLLMVRDCPESCQQEDFWHQLPTQVVDEDMLPGFMVLRYLYLHILVSPRSLCYVMQLHCNLFASYISARSGTAAEAEKGPEKEGRAAEEGGRLGQLENLCRLIASKGHESAQPSSGSTNELRGRGRGVTVAGVEANYALYIFILSTRRCTRYPCCITLLCHASKATCIS